MLNLTKTDSSNKNFQNLVIELDKYLAGINGDSNDFFVQFNKIDKLNHVILAIKNQQFVGCGAMKEIEKDTVEIKRMFVQPNIRGKGVASAILFALENWAKELNYKKSVLETSNKMHDAMHLYIKNDYKIIPNYGQYRNVATSVCFEKNLVESA